MSSPYQENSEQAAFDRLSGMAKYCPGFKVPEDVVIEVSRKMRQFLTCLYRLI